MTLQEAIDQLAAQPCLPGDNVHAGLTVVEELERCRERCLTLKHFRMRESLVQDLLRVLDSACEHESTYVAVVASAVRDFKI